ncbi:MAG: glycosyltransferase family 4 protein [Candidatus Sumerlaeia bacterium]|nr:glycosyltransferase family 4 protein [Candidatus Sumerlaeia bacterium]
MIRIGVTNRRLGTRGSGVAEYLHHTLTALGPLCADSARLVLFPPASAADRVARLYPFAEVVPVPDAPFAVMDHWLAPRLMNRARLDVAWLPQNALPLGLKAPAVVTFLDLLYLMPEYRAYPLHERLLWPPLFRRSARRAAAIVCISDQTRRDALRLLGPPPERLHVVHLAPGPEFQPVADPACLDDVRRRLGLPPRYILYAGSLSPRKNITRLLDAFRSVRDRIPHDLVLTGARVWGMDRLDRLTAGTADRVHLLGHVAPEDMPALYTMADVYAHPSLYEGFGLTVLEAQACGVPVLNSTAPPMPEVAGDSTLLVDPTSVPALAAGLERLCLDDALRADLRARGFANAARYTWPRAAAALLALLQAAARPTGD